jgi:kanamycin kinase/aminoglycoside 3'-phosphotransferase-3
LRVSVFTKERGWDNLKKTENNTKAGFPAPIQEILQERNYTADSVGQSDSQVLLFSDMVLKIQADSEESRNESQMLAWLSGRLPVPKRLACAVQGGRSFLLMSRAKGEMLAEEKFLKTPARLLDLLAQGLKNLWAVDIKDCPCDNLLSKRLSAARKNVENGLVDVEDAEPGTFGKAGFENPDALLNWLEQNRPKEELYLTHGDFCLPNVFAENGQITGYIDLGKAGVADRWQDIALCYRSLKQNFGGKFGAKNRDFSPDALFEKLGIPKDPEKLQYYILLDELF